MLGDGEKKRGGWERERENRRRTPQVGTADATGSQAVWAMVLAAKRAVRVKMVKCMVAFVVVVE